MKTNQYTLKNGLRLLTIDTGSFPTVTAIVMVGAGSRYEENKNNGVAHFFEHMAFKGSKKFPNSYAISSTIEGIGGMFNAFTSKDHTGYWIKATSEHTSLMLDVLSDMVLHPLLAPEEIEREKGVIIEEINMYEDMPARKVGDVFENVLYQGSSLGMDIAGTKDTVAAFTRDTFTSYIDELYQPNNTVVVLAGGLDQLKSQKSPLRQGFEGQAGIRSIKEEIEERFGKWKGNKVSTYKPFIDSQQTKQVVVRTKKTEQVHMCVGYRAFSFADKRKYALQLLSVILGGGMSSRLFMQVRERRGLCYYISTGRELYADTGSIVTQAGIANDKKKINEAIRVIIAEHEGIAENEVSEDELQRAKELVKGRFLISLEDSAHVATGFGTKLLLENKVQDVSEVIKQIESVSSKEITILAQELFKKEKLNIALIGPYVKEDIQC